MTGARARLISGVVLVVLMAGACAGGASKPTPTPPHDDPIVEGGCVHTDTVPTGILKEFWAVDCDAPDARYRVVSITFSSMNCPQTAEYTVTRVAQTYCLSDDTTGKETPPIDFSVTEGDCIDVEGLAFIDSLHKIDCDDAAADYRVIDVRAGPGLPCPAPADTSIELKIALGVNKDLCLESL